MINRKELVLLLDSWLEPSLIKDYTVNGLQFEGKSNITHIGVAVDVSLKTLQKAGESGVDFLITHHGLIWGGLKKITSFDKKRIQVLCDHNINLYCSHLPLDKHPHLGNNAQIINLLDAQNTLEPFFEVGYYATIDTDYNILISLIKEKISTKIVEMNFGPQKIDKIAVCSGGAGLDLRALFEAYEKDVFTIISGETNSLYYHYAEELKMNIICAGHYATETFGINALMRKIQKIYSNEKTIKYIFIDLPTGF